MSKKTIALAATVVFLVSLNGCFQFKRNAKTDAVRLRVSEFSKPRIVAIQKKTGERLEFPRKGRATIVGDKVVVPEQSNAVSTRLLWADIKDFKEDTNGRITEIMMNDGRFFKVVGFRKDEQGVTLQRATLYRFISSLSDLDLVWVKKTNWPLTIAVNTLITAAVAAAFVLATFEMEFSIPEGESCPFVYSFDGQDYVLDAEPYGGAVCQGLERVDWVGLDNLKPVDGKYKLLLANELEEAEYVDELKLAAVDHPAGVTVVPELSGKMRTVASPRSPVSARDADGRDILPLIGAMDKTFWLSRVEGRDPENDEDLKDELILEFPKPVGARSAKLIANAWWTEWGTQAIKPILEAQGRNLGPFINEINAGGPALFSVMRWLAREEMYNLQVRVETDAGWKTKALIFGGGPMIAKDKAYPLDLSDVPGDTVRVKFTPAAGFWMIDYLGLDFTEDVPVRVTELAAESALDDAGRDIGAELASDDGKYFIIPRGARPATLAFAVPPETPGLARTVFLKARGYYDLELVADGEPTLDLNDTVNKPGESIRLALRTHPALSRPSPRLH